MPPDPFTLFHHAVTAGAKAEPMTTSMSADANPAAKLLVFGFIDGRYRKPEPEECGGMMKMSYLPGGRPEDFGLSPWGGGGGGAFMVEGWSQDQKVCLSAAQGAGVSLPLFNVCLTDTIVIRNRGILVGRRRCHKIVQ
jgi:hypothetical protein